MTIGERIKQLRKEQGLTQDELAQKVGYKSRSSINKIETGERDIQRSTIMDFARALNTTPGYLMGWEDEPEDDGIKIIDENDNIVVYDDETRDIIDSLRTRPEMKILFSVTRKATKEDILKAVKIIEALKEES